MHTTATHARPIRMIIADDHPIILGGLQAHLTPNPEFQIVGVATNFKHVHSLLASIDADVLILDLTGMQGSPLMTVERIRREHPAVAIVVFSSALNLAPALLQAGVNGYVLKENLVEQLDLAVHTALAGEVFISEAVTTYLQNAKSRVNTFKLLPQELRVLSLMSQGLRTLEIALALGIEANTVQNYITSLRRKTGCAERTQLINWYRQLYGDGSN